MAGNLSPEAQRLVNSSKQAYKTQILFSNYSDDEVRELMYDAMQKGLAATNTNRMIEAYKYIGQKQACEEFLEERNNIKINSEKAEEEWPDIMHKLQNEAVLNLKTAITPNAQLIAAVLEEEGDLTEDELAGWCEELASLPEDEFRLLLNGMEEEKAIIRKDGKYHLHNICTPSLFPDDIKWFMQEISDGTGTEERKAIELKVLDMLSSVGAKTAYSIPLYMESYARVYPDDVLNEENVKDHWLLKEGSRTSAFLRSMAIKGLLCMYMTSTTPVYYFPMLGNKEDE